MIGTLKDLTLNRDGTQNITVTVTENFREQFDELSDCKVSIEIKKARQHRSLDANAYCWKLIDLISAKTGISKTEIYRAAIKEIGGVSTIVCVQDKAVDRLREGWQKNGLGWQSDTFKSQIEGCTNVILYYGSSTYDTAQMSRLIDGIIQEAEQQGIPTITEKEEAELLTRWKK